MDKFRQSGTLSLWTRPNTQHDLLPGQIDSDAFEGLSSLFMTVEEALVSVWRQAIVDGEDAVQLDGKPFPVKLLRAKKLRFVEFSFDQLSFVGIEQNPQTNSRWAHLARKGSRIMQFRSQGRYVANVCEGKCLKYPAWRAMELPD